MAGAVLGALRSCCGRSATSATARSRGCRRSAGRRRRGRSRARQWWPFLLLVASTGRWSRSPRGLLAPPRPRRRASSRRGPGARDAAASLGRPVGLAVRLQRGSVIGWGVGMLLTGVAYGSIADSINDFVKDNKALTDIIAARVAANLADSYLAMSFRILALVVCGFRDPVRVLQSRGEETAQHAEQILATPVSRRRWASSHLLVAGGGSVLLLLVAGLSFGVLRRARDQRSAR